MEEIFRKLLTEVLWPMLRAALPNLAHSLLPGIIPADLGGRRTMIVRGELSTSAHGEVRRIGPGVYALTSAAPFGWIVAQLLHEQSVSFASSRIRLEDSTHATIAWSDCAGTDRDDAFLLVWE